MNMTKPDVSYWFCFFFEYSSLGVLKKVYYFRICSSSMTKSQNALYVPNILAQPESKGIPTSGINLYANNYFYMFS